MNQGTFDLTFSADYQLKETVTSEIIGAIISLWFNCVKVDHRPVKITYYFVFQIYDNHENLRTRFVTIINTNNNKV